MTDRESFCKICATTDFALAFDPSRWKVNGPDGKALGYPDDRAVVHQPSVASLREFALKGCPACYFFLEALKVPLRPQQPEDWGTYEAKESKKAKKATKRDYDAARRREEELGPCLIVSINVEDMHEKLASPKGAVAGFRYGPTYGFLGTAAIGVIVSTSSPNSIGTRNLLNCTDTGLCREWLKQCQTEHQTCPPISDRNLPTRLIDVGEPCTGTDPKLIETGGQQGQYITLSHCWGQSKPPSTTKANLLSHMSYMLLQ